MPWRVCEGSLHEGSQNIKLVRIVCCCCCCIAAAVLAKHRLLHTPMIEKAVLRASRSHGVIELCCSIVHADLKEWNERPLQIPNQTEEGRIYRAAPGMNSACGCSFLCRQTTVPRRRGFCFNCCPPKILTPQLLS